MKIYKKLLSYVPEFRYKAVIAIFLSIVSVLLTIYGYYLMNRFLRLIIIGSNYIAVTDLALKIFSSLLIAHFVYFVSVLTAHSLGFRLETNLRKKGIEGLNKASFRFFDTHPSGIVRKTIDDNAALTHTIVAHLIPDNTRAILMPLLVIALGFFINLRVGLVITALTILTGILLAMMTESVFMQEYQKAMDDLSAETVEYVRGISVIKVFGVSIQSMKKLFELIKHYSDNAYLYSRKCKKIYTLYQLIFFASAAILVALSAIFLAKFSNINELIIDLIMSMFLSSLMFTAMMKVMYVQMYTFQGNYAVDTLEKLYKEMEDEKILFGNERYFNNHNIEFKNVSFSYNDKIVIKDLSFKLEENKIYALVGKSGSGKSTVAKLISGYYKVDSGEILIGGKNVEKYSEDALMNEISFVFQDSKLFKKSIYDNILLAKPCASHEAVINAMNLAGVDKIIEKFPNKENTIIGSKGVYLSGGEKQRIAIARAILKDSNIIIMDEASAAIDPDNEHELQKAFKNLMKDKTVIMIAHRLSAIKGVNEIIFIEDGKIIERDSHDNLMNKDSKYKKLFNLYKEANDWRIIDEKLS